MPETETPLLSNTETKPDEQTVTTTTSDSELKGGEQSQESKGDASTETKETKETPKGAPEVYEFSIPEGLPEGSDDKQVLDAYATAARELNLTQDQAQPLFEKTMTAFYKRGQELQAAQTKEWTETSEKDSEFGGAKLQENLGIAKKALKEFGSDGLRKMLDSEIGDGRGFTGNHPEVLRFLFRVGLAVSEDRFLGGSKAGDTTVALTDDQAIADKLYNKTPKTP